MVPESCSKRHVGIRCDLQREALRGEGHIFPAVGIEVGEKDRIDTVRPFGARDERIFELPVAGGSRSRRLDGFGGFDVRRGIVLHVHRARSLFLHGGNQL